MALGCFGLGREDAMTHLLNVVWPNIFETSPHVINAVMDAIEGLRVALGPARILQYTLQVRQPRPIPSARIGICTHVHTYTHTDVQAYVPVPCGRR
jgi:hypothetical protein